MAELPMVEGFENIIDGCKFDKIASSSCVVLAMTGRVKPDGADIANPMRNKIGRSNLSFYHNAKFVNSVGMGKMLG